MKEGNPLPKRLNELRKTRGLSQKQLGINAGIDEFSASPRINQYEKGKHTPDFTTLRKLAEVLAVPTAYFYAEDDLLAEVIRLFAARSEVTKEKIISTLRNHKEQSKA